jgi:hypothetical protein
MIAAGMHAVLIKVAGIGLQPKHLGKTLAEMQSVLTSLVSMLHRCAHTGLLTLVPPERTLWLACLWRRRRIREPDTRLPLVQEADSFVSRI